MKFETTKTIIIEFTEEEFTLLARLSHKVTPEKVGEKEYTLLCDIEQGVDTH